uniref:ribosomal protein L32 n=1 Tax=Pseudoerythrocladia kornmannii TaxID=753682 RepID=UPI001BEE0325|nr:ribosomal protein L32 [Pseudoerythrocladia kornmannii]QUE28184.1 ribosomal protein L32 [Pseudoerythrocladia kornmannii]UNJ16688.1 ribosomal protein L32 [Pseudoerythrocladia kornmannii]
MAVPKKRTSKTKKNSRKSQWKKQAESKAIKAFSLAKSVLTGKSKSFIYSSQGDDD